MKLIRETDKETKELSKIRDIAGDSYFVDYFPNMNGYYFMCRLCEISGVIHAEKLIGIKKLTIKHQCK